MTSDINDIISFGTYLKRLRIEKGLNLKDISGETRISTKMLTLIEDENLDELPNQTIVKGFLRAYADALGVGNEEIIKSFMAVAKGEKMTAPGNFIKENGKKRNVTIIFLVLIACSGVLAFFLMNQQQQKGVPLKESPQPVVVEEKVPEPQPAPVVEEAEPKIPERQRLLINTVEETWLKIIIDDQPPKEYSLAPGDQLEMEALTGFNILIGNAGGVRLTLNDKPVHVSGKSGQAVNIQLP